MSANQCYFNGDYYQCAEDAAPGESPATHPAKWRKVQLPKAWRWCLTRLALANLLDQDGQSDKALSKRSEAISTERTGLEDLVRKEANDHRWIERICVQKNDLSWR